MEFVIKEFPTAEGEEMEYRVVNVIELLDEIDKLRDNKEKKFAVFTIGRCVLDWS